MRLWWGSRLGLWMYSVEWRETLSVEVSAAGTAEVTAGFDTDRTASALAELAKRGEGRGPQGQAREALCCPICRSELQWSSSEAGCSGCSSRFPVVASVPLLIAEARIGR